MKSRPVTPTPPTATARPAAKRGIPLAAALSEAGIRLNGIQRFPTSYLTPMINRIKVSGLVDRAIEALGKKGINVIHVMQISELALSEVFATSDLPGLIRGQKTGAKAISTYDLSVFIKQRTWQVKGIANLLKEIRITDAVKARLEEWDRTTPGAKTIEIGQEVTKAELEIIFSSHRLEGATLEPRDILIGIDQAPVVVAPTPESTTNSVFARELAGARENFPQTMAARVKAAFEKPLDELLADAETLCGPIGSIEEDKDKKPAREACKGRLRQNVQAIVDQLEDNAASAQRLAPLLRLMAHLGILRLAEELLKQAQEQDKTSLYIELCLETRKATKGLSLPKEAAYFWYLEGQFHEQSDNNDSAKTCYNHAIGFDPDTKTYSQAIRKLERKEMEKELAILQQFRDLWERALAETKATIGKAQTMIDASGESKQKKKGEEPAFKTGDGGKLFDDVNKDCFAVAQQLKHLLLPQPQAAPELAAWLNKKPLALAQKVLEEVISSISGFRQSPSGYALLFALAPQIEDASLQELCQVLKDEILNNIVQRMSQGRRFSFSEGFMLCVAIEDEGVIFPDKKADIDKLLNLPQAAYGRKGEIAYMFAHRIYMRLYADPSARLIEAVRRGDVAGVEKQVEEAAEAAPEGEADRLRVLNYCIAAEEFAHKDKFELADQYIKKAQAIDPESKHVDRALGVYNWQQGNHDLAVEYIEKAIAKTDEKDIYALANTAIQLYINIADDHKPEPFLRRAAELAIIVHKHKPNNTHNCYLATIIYNALDDQESFLVWIRNFMAALKNCETEEDLGIAEATGQSDRESLIELLGGKSANEEITQLIEALQAFTS